MDHDGLDLVLVALLIEVNFVDWRQLVPQCRVCVAGYTRAPPDQVGVDIDLAYLLRDVEQGLPLGQRELAKDELGVMMPDPLKTLLSKLYQLRI